ncbi:MAG: glycosyltransferase family 2 protein [Candidatus Lernaella stagnicola]|nr:glycosyltransferase family 2 protein [Candidatus Lernaella stagnicola]
MDLSIVVPAYNESENLPGLLEKLEHFVLMAPCKVEVIVVDDGSTDQSAALLRHESAQRPWLTPMILAGNGGMGAALKAGTSRTHYPLVSWVMADRSDNLDDLLEMRKHLQDGADLVVASRAVFGGSYGELRGAKALGSRYFSAFSRWLLRLPIDDSTNAFRAFRRSIFVELQLQRHDFGISPEMVFRAQALKLHIEQVPTTYSFRRKGQSQFAIIRMGLIYLRLTLRAFLARLGRGD